VDRLRTAGWWVGGVGATGIAAGGAAGIVALVDNTAATRHCLAPTACDAQGVRLGSAARTAGNVATVAFSVGGAALATGVVLLVAAPRSTMGALPPYPRATSTAAAKLWISAGVGPGFVALGAAR
jgi:hypothetical protein